MTKRTDTETLAEIAKCRAFKAFFLKELKQALAACHRAGLTYNMGRWQRRPPPIPFPPTLGVGPLEILADVDIPLDVSDAEIEALNEAVNGLRAAVRHFGRRLGGLHAGISNRFKPLKRPPLYITPSVVEEVLIRSDVRAQSKLRADFWSEY